MSGRGDRITATVAVVESGRGRSAACALCGHELGPASEPWKPQTRMHEVPLVQAGGPAFDTGFDGVVLRHFYCPGCAGLLDTETATPQDPVLNDKLTEDA